MIEWNLSTDKTIILFLFLFWLCWKVWHIENKDHKDIVREKAEETSEQLNPDYGAYIWFAGKRFN